MVRYISNNFGREYLCIENKEDINNYSVSSDNTITIYGLIRVEELNDDSYPIYFTHFTNNPWWNKVPRSLWYYLVNYDIKVMDETIIKLHHFLDSIED